MCLWGGLNYDLYPLHSGFLNSRFQRGRLITFFFFLPFFFLGTSLRCHFLFYFIFSRLIPDTGPYSTGEARSCKRVASTDSCNLTVFTHTGVSFHILKMVELSMFFVVREPDSSYRKIIFVSWTTFFVSNSTTVEFFGGSVVPLGWIKLRLISPTLRVLESKSRAGSSIFFFFSFLFFSRHPGMQMPLSPFFLD